MSVAPADSTLIQIRSWVRQLTACSSESALPTSTIDQQINTFYNSDFPYDIKLDQMRSVYTFYTSPYVDTYPLDVNYNQGVRAPIYVDGVQGWLFKERDQFYNMWPRWPTLFQPISGDGMTTSFSFTIPGPFLSNNVTLGGVDANGVAIRVEDDGHGNLMLQTPNPVTTVPQQRSSNPIPGMLNQNLGNPGLNAVLNIGTVNYVTGVFAVTFPVAPIAGQTMNLFVSQYQTGRPYSILFWNNYFVIRPVPRLIHKIEIETYLTPVQFMQSTDSPILNQWAQYISYGVAVEILRLRQDMEGVANLMEGFKRQEGLVLQRQGVEEIGSRNATIFSASQQNGGFNNGFFGNWGY